MKCEWDLLVFCKQTPSQLAAIGTLCRGFSYIKDGSYSGGKINKKFDRSMNFIDISENSQVEAFNTLLNLWLVN